MKKVFSISLFFMLMISISIFAVTKTLRPGNRSWSTPNAWDPRGVPSALDDVIIPSGSTDLTIDVNAVCLSFTIEAGFTGPITFSGSSTLTVNGDWTNSGAPTLGSGLILIGGNFTNNNASLNTQNTDFTFNGTSGQTISSASTPLPTTTTFGDLVIDKPSGTIQLLSDVAVEITFTETNGTLDENGNTLWINGSPLPVELSSFSASVTKTGVKLLWRTETEVNNYGFEILRQAQDDEWEVLGFVEGYGNSNSPKEYNFLDSEVNSAGTYSYRLKQIDNDGTYEFSKAIEVNFGSPIKFELNQNYPNPFNPSTTISFTLLQSGNVALKVFNSIGEEIVTLADGFIESGVYTFNFNAEGLPSGMYISQLSTPEKTQARKMILMK